MKKADRKIVRIAAVGDLHCTKTSQRHISIALFDDQPIGRPAGPLRRPDRLWPA